MNWGDFKKQVETQGVTDDTEIGWVDVSGEILLVQKNNKNAVDDSINIIDL